MRNVSVYENVNNKDLVSWIPRLGTAGDFVEHEFTFTLYHIPVEIAKRIRGDGLELFLLKVYFSIAIIFLS